MADKTQAKETVSRKEFATYLRNLADQFESEGDAQISVGNKSVTVNPAQTVKREIRVIERSAILRGDKQAIDLEVKWKRSE
jgi:amphi-Trp domain-containing protein